MLTKVIFRPSSLNVLRLPSRVREGGQPRHRNECGDTQVLAPARSSQGLSEDTPLHKTSDHQQEPWAPGAQVHTLDKVPVQLPDGEAQCHTRGLTYLLMSQGASAT